MAANGKDAGTNEAGLFDFPALLQTGGSAAEHQRSHPPICISLMTQVSEVAVTFKETLIKQADPREGEFLKAPASRDKPEGNSSKISQMKLADNSTPLYL